MRENVFRPLGMTRSRFYSPTQLITDRAVPYQITESGVAMHGPFISDSFGRCADTGMMSTARDMARWAVAIDSAKLIPSALWNEISRPVRLNQGWTFPYGLGLYVGEMQERPYIGHGGTFLPGYSAALIRWPARAATVIVLTNKLPSNSAPWQLAEDLLATFDPDFIPISRSTLRADPQPELTKALAGLLSEEIAAADAIKPTEAFRKLQLKVLKQMLSGGTFVFVSCGRASSRAAAALNTTVNRVCIYEVRKQESRRRLMFFLTPDNQLAGADW
jgi:CubicO group peptidase (beta-lactamase class C family)